MKLIIFCVGLIMFAYCCGYHKNPNIKELIKNILESKQTFTQSHVKPAKVVDIKVDVLSTYVLNGNQKKCVDCSEILRNIPRTQNHDGVYTIYPDHLNAKEVYCDMTTDGGGWTVIQKRVDGSTDFYRTWREYKEGFGNAHHNYWIGNDVIHQLTKIKPQKLRVDLQKFSGVKGHGKYSSFAISDENDKYKLTVSGFNGGKIGNSLDGVHNGMKFTTKDQDNDLRKNGNCAHQYFGGWWYNNGYNSNLNGKYAKSAVSGVMYNTWGGFNHLTALKSTQMMIRP